MQNLKAKKNNAAAKINGTTIHIKIKVTFDIVLDLNSTV